MFLCITNTRYTHPSRNHSSLVSHISPQCRNSPQLLSLRKPQILINIIWPLFVSTISVIFLFHSFLLFYWCLHINRHLRRLAIVSLQYMYLILFFHHTTYMLLLFGIWQPNHMNFSLQSSSSAPFNGRQIPTARNNLLKGFVCASFRLKFQVNFAYISKYAWMDWYFKSQSTLTMEYSFVQQMCGIL